MFCSEAMAEKIMLKNNGTLDISDTWITQLPDNLTVRGGSHFKSLHKRTAG